ncbi:MAG: hypothetical protein ACO2OO_02365 [Candidatus Aenigmatarchaeota archaeon]|jgi:hypothetical protein
MKKVGTIKKIKETRVYREWELDKVPFPIRIKRIVRIPSTSGTLIIGETDNEKVKIFLSDSYEIPILDTNNGKKYIMDKDLSIYEEDDDLPV